MTRRWPRGAGAGQTKAVEMLFELLDRLAGNHIVVKDRREAIARCILDVIDLMLRLAQHRGWPREPQPGSIAAQRWAAR